MTVDNNGPRAAYPGPDENPPDTGEEHGSGLEQAPSEPKQGGERPEDWNPPPSAPDDSGVRTDRDSVDDELGFDPDSPDVSDPQIDPPHPARTSNDPVPSKD